MKNELEPIQELVSGYLDLLKHPRKIVGKMTYDEYCDWLEPGSLEDLIAARKVFVKDNLTRYVDVIDTYIKKLQK
jgi:hypothetical protein